MIARLSRREQNLITAGASIVFVMLFFIYLLQPKWDKLNADQVQLANLKSKIEILKTERAIKAKEKPEPVEMIKNDIRALRSQLPVTRDTAGFVSFLISAANSAQVNLDQVSTGEITPNNAVKGTSSQSFNIKVSGSYRQVRSFLTNLENLQRLNHINSINLTKDETGIMQLNITMDVYSWSSGDPSLNDQDTIPLSPEPGKPDPYDSVSAAVYNN